MLIIMIIKIIMMIVVVVNIINTYAITLVLLKLLLQPFDVEAPLHLSRLTDDRLDLLGGRGLHLVSWRADRSGARLL